MVASEFVIVQCSRQAWINVRMLCSAHLGELSQCLLARALGASQRLDLGLLALHLLLVLLDVCLQRLCTQQALSASRHVGRGK